MAIFSIKPADMKTPLSGTLTAVALIGLSIAAVLSFRATAQTPQSTPGSGDEFVLTINTPPGKYHLLKDSTPPGETAFKELLCDRNRHFDKTKRLHFKSGIGSQAECDLPADCSKFASPAQLKIKTDKVTVANTAQSIAGGDPNVTIKIASTSPDDIKTVLDLLAP